MTNTRRSDILTSLSDLDDGTGDLGIIVDQAIAYAPTISDSEVRDYVLDAQADARECASCGSKPSSVSAPTDQAGWDRLAREHSTDCEWIATRGYTKFEPVGSTR